MDLDTHIQGERFTGRFPVPGERYTLFVAEDKPFSVISESGAVYENCRALLTNGEASRRTLPEAAGPVFRFAFGFSPVPGDAPSPLDGCSLLKSFFDPGDRNGMMISMLSFRALSSAASQAARMLLSACSVSDAFSDPLSLCYLNALLLELCRSGYADAEIHDASAGENEFGRIMTFIEQNAADASLDDVAEAFHYHPKTVAGILRRNSGCSFSDVRNRFRMERAEKLLNSGSSVRDAAAACGYHNMTNFYTRFEAYFGRKPGERKTNNAGPSEEQDRS